MKNFNLKPELSVNDLIAHGYSKVLIKFEKYAINYTNGINIGL